MVMEFSSIIVIHVSFVLCSSSIVLILSNSLYCVLASYPKDPQLCTHNTERQAGK